MRNQSRLEPSPIFALTLYYVYTTVSVNVTALMSEFQLMGETAVSSILLFQSPSAGERTDVIHKPTIKQIKTSCLSVGCLTSQQYASVSQGRICTDNIMCCHTETEVADQTFYLIQSQYTDTGLTSPSADPITPGVWQGNHWSKTNWEQ